MVAFAWVCWSILLIVVICELIIIIGILVGQVQGSRLNLFRLASDVMPFVFLCIYLFS